MNLKLKSIISSVVIGGLLFTSASAALASSTDSSASDTQKAETRQAGNMKAGGMPGDMHGRRGPMGQNGLEFGQDGIKTLTESLVNEGIITQEVADKMISYTNEKDTERKAEMEKVKSMTEEERKAYFESKSNANQDDSKKEGRSDQYAEMVTAGILTQDQADSINKYVETQQQAKRQEEMENRYDSLVDEGIITQEVADSMISYTNEKDTERKAEMEKVKSMTEEERKAYFESKSNANQDDSKKEGRSDQYAEMVTAGILTQDQADAINAYFNAQQQAKRQEALKKQLDSLVSDSTITQDQQDEIITYLEQQDESRKAEMEKVKSMTDEERKTYFESRKDVKSEDKASLLQGLIDDGTLTQAQADAVAEVLQPNGPGAGQSIDK